jgi:hypothetical protein
MNILKVLFYTAKGVEAAKEYKGRPLDMIGDGIKGLLMALLIAVGFAVVLFIGIMWFFIKASHG